MPDTNGGVPPLSYEFDPALPAGLDFDFATRILSGTPTGTQPATAHTYAVTDSALNPNNNEPAPDTARLTLTITVLFDPTSPPGQPAHFTATAGNRAVTRRWTDPDDATITEYEYKPWTEPAPGTGTDIPGSTVTTTSHIVTGLTNGTEYNFRIRAVNAHGDGAVSTVATATPTTAPPPGDGDDGDDGDDSRSGGGGSGGGRRAPADQHGDTPAAATALDPTAPTAPTAGYLQSRTDEDDFRLDLPAPGVLRAPPPARPPPPASSGTPRRAAPLSAWPKTRTGGRGGTCSLGPPGLPARTPWPGPPAKPGH